MLGFKCQGGRWVEKQQAFERPSLWGAGEVGIVGTDFQMFTRIGKKVGENGPVLLSTHTHTHTLALSSLFLEQPFFHFP